MNTRIYEQARAVPDEAMKPITAGRLKGFTDINPMWRIKRLTEIFGPCGLGWWYEISDKRIEHDSTTGQSAAFVDILLFYKDPKTLETSHGIPGTGGSSFVAKEKAGPYMSDECFKMALSDAISVAAKAIGLGANVYYAKDRSKYENAEPETAPAKTEPLRDTKFRCADCGKVLEPYPDKNGVVVSLRKHAQGSESRFGKVLCLECIEQNYAD